MLSVLPEMISKPYNQTNSNPSFNFPCVPSGKLHITHRDFSWGPCFFILKAGEKGHLEIRRRNRTASSISIEKKEVLPVVFSLVEVAGALCLISSPWFTSSPEESYSSIQIYWASTMCHIQFSVLRVGQWRTWCSSCQAPSLLSGVLAAAWHLLGNMFQLHRASI